MPWKTKVLVVANVTADSDELLSALEHQAARSPTSFTLILPPRTAGQAGRQAAEERLARALASARERGLEIEGSLGDPDPIHAVTEAFDPRLFDEIIVSTLPAGASRWMLVDLPHRVGRLTGAPVRHVVAAERRSEARTTSRPRSESRGVLDALTPLTWGRRPDDKRRGPARETPAREPGDAGAPTR